MGLGAGDNFTRSFHEAGEKDNIGDTKKKKKKRLMKLKFANCSQKLKDEVSQARPRF